MNTPETEITVSKDGAELLRTTVTPGDYVIGREAGCALVVPVDGISRRHAKLTINFDHALIEELGSSNGTFVADRKITEITRLFPNQTIRIGSVTMQLRRFKFQADPDSLSPHSAAVKRHLPPDFLRDGKYDIGGIIAQGGMGAIVDAQEKLLRRKVAMKVMLHSGSQEQLLRFIEEAQITGQLEHPNIVPVYELGVDEQEQVFYTMKLVRGTTLQDVLKHIESGAPDVVEKYPLTALLTIFQKVCDALAFAHSKGVIHRDLKPENVMLGEYGEVLVMDWGLARVSGRNEAAGAGPERTLVSSARQDEGAAMMTMVGMVLGTPQYMPPEQARGETEKFDARTDIYSLGAILYHILTLEPPISGDDIDLLLQSVSEGKVAAQVAGIGPRRVQSARTLRHIPGGQIPEPLAAITRKAMAMERGERYQTVKELQAAVQAFQLEPPAAATPSPTAATAVPERKGKGATVLVIALCAVIAVLIGVCVKLASDRGKAEAALHAKP